LSNAADALETVLWYPGSEDNQQELIVVDLDAEISVMLLVRPGSLRTGLLALLKSVKGIATIETCPDPNSCLQYIIKQRPSLAIVDGDSSKDDLPALLRTIKSESPTTSCILLNENLSGNWAAGDLQVDGVVQHGAHPNELVKMIESLISHNQKLKGEGKNE
jgi:DNA-binding NarL/FixJ family response regulator